MCCEATDALLEYVRRHLSLTGLRNLNAPRRLKLRVPVLKEWLQRMGHGALASEIPDWDPIRRPTGRWKSWEIIHLKPIMDEKAIERQAKRKLVSGEALVEDRHAAAIEGLTALQHSQMSSQDDDDILQDGDDDDEPRDRPELDQDLAIVVMDDGGRGTDGSAQEAGGGGGGGGLSKAADSASHLSHARILASHIHEVLATLAPNDSEQRDALDGALAAAKTLQHRLQSSELAACECRPAGLCAGAAEPHAMAAPIAALHESNSGLGSAPSPGFLPAAFDCGSQMAICSQESVASCRAVAVDDIEVVDDAAEPPSSCLSHLSGGQLSQEFAMHDLPLKGVVKAECMGGGGSPAPPTGACVDSSQSTSPAATPASIEATV